MLVFEPNPLLVLFPNELVVLFPNRPPPEFELALLLPKSPPLEVLVFDPKRPPELDVLLFEPNRPPLDSFQTATKLEVDAIFCVINSTWTVNMLSPRDMLLFR